LRFKRLRFVGNLVQANALELVREAEGRPYVIFSEALPPLPCWRVDTLIYVDRKKASLLYLPCQLFRVQFLAGWKQLRAVLGPHSLPRCSHASAAAKKSPIGLVQFPACFGFGTTIVATRCLTVMAAKGFHPRRNSVSVTQAAPIHLYSLAC